MSDDLIDRVRKVKRQIEDHNKELERNKGKLDSLYAQLQKQCGTKDLDEAATIMEKAWDEVEALKDQKKQHEQQLDKIEGEIHA